MDVERSCTHDGCDFSLRTKSRDAGSPETTDTLAAHIAGAHDGVGTYRVRERRAWVLPLAIANGVAVVVSAILAITSAAGSDGGGLFILGIVFPQVWGTVVWPALGVGIILGAAVISAIVAFSRPAGVRRGTFLAAMTMTGFVVWIAISASALIFLAWLSATWTT